MSKSPQLSRAATPPHGGGASRLAPPYARAALESLIARHGSPLFVIDCDQLRAQYRQLAAALPGVALHYALKPLPQPAVVATLSAEGSGFDVATSGEIDLVRAAQGAARHRRAARPRPGKAAVAWTTARLLERAAPGF